MTRTDVAPAVTGNPFGAPCGLVSVDGEIVTDREAAVDVHAHVLSYGELTTTLRQALWGISTRTQPEHPEWTTPR